MGERPRRHPAAAPLIAAAPASIPPITDSRIQNNPADTRGRSRGLLHARAVRSAAMPPEPARGMAIAAKQAAGLFLFPIEELQCPPVGLP